MYTLPVAPTERVVGSASGRCVGSFLKLVAGSQSESDSEGGGESEGEGEGEAESESESEGEGEDKELTLKRIKTK